MDYAITITDGSNNQHTVELSYEEMVEILVAIERTPIHGNECFDAAKTKAIDLMKLMPSTNY